MRVYSVYGRMVEDGLLPRMRNSSSCWWNDHHVYGKRVEVLRGRSGRYEILRRFTRVFPGSRLTTTTLEVGSDRYRRNVYGKFTLWELSMYRTT